MYWPSHRRRSPQGTATVITRVVRPFFIVLLIVIGLAGCTLIRPKEAPPLKRVTAEELTTLLRQREAAVHSMKGLFTAKVRGGLMPIATRVEGTVHYRRPNAVRLRGFTPIGNELFEFVQADDWYKLRLPLEGKVYSGRQSDMKDLGKLARFSQLSAWAVGGVLGTSAITHEETVEVVEDRDRYRLDVYTAFSGEAGAVRHAIRRLWFDRRLLVVQEDRLGTDGDVEATIQYDDFRRLDDSETGPERVVVEQDGPLLRPFKVSLVDGHGEGSIQVTFHELHHNQTINAKDLGQAS
ncbi:MAG: hypothetical protein OEU68_04895 [Nitrospira sp.]|nr:hypothetical protein [Nitrospira sp.]